MCRGSTRVPSFPIRRSISAAQTRRVVRANSPTNHLSYPHEGSIQVILRIARERTPWENFFSCNELTNNPKRR